MEKVIVIAVVLVSVLVVGILQMGTNSNANGIMDSYSMEVESSHGYQITYGATVLLVSNAVKVNIINKGEDGFVKVTLTKEADTAYLYVVDLYTAVSEEVYLKAGTQGSVYLPYILKGDYILRVLSRRGQDWEETSSEYITLDGK